MMKPPVVVMLKIDQKKLPAQTFRRISKQAGSVHNWKKREEAAWENFGKQGRDFAKLQGVLAVVAQKSDWIPYLKLAQLRNHWDQIVGPAIAQHSQVMNCTDGILVIRAESQVWATQLTYLIPQLNHVICERLVGLSITQIKVTGPHAYPFTRKNAKK